MVAARVQNFLESTRITPPASNNPINPNNPNKPVRFIGVIRFISDTALYQAL
jgi:hypothetical protein